MAPTVSPTNNQSRSRTFLGRAREERRTPKTIDRYRRLLSLFARGPHSGLWGPKSERVRFGSKRSERTLTELSTARCYEMNRCRRNPGLSFTPYAESSTCSPNGRLVACDVARGRDSPMQSSKLDRERVAAKWKCGTYQPRWLCET